VHGRVGYEPDRLACDYRQHNRDSLVLTRGLSAITSFFTRPKLDVNVFKDPLRVGPPGAPEQKRRRVFFQVWNIGKSTAPNCRAVLRLPKIEYRPSSFPPESLPESKNVVFVRSRDGPVEAKISEYLQDNIELEWFRMPGGVNVEYQSTFGKSVDLPPRSSDFFFAGVILVDRVQKNIFNKVGALLTVSANTHESKPGVVELVHQLECLSQGEPMEVRLELSWERESIKTVSHRYRVQVRAFDAVDFTEISDC